jgi:hypothetical protein
VARAELITVTGAVPLVAMTPNARALPFRVVADDEPLKVAVVALWPLDIELQSDAVERYVRDELGGEPSFTERYRAQGHWRERYTKNAKTLIRTSGERPAAIATQPHGLSYELVPSTDPTLTEAGTAFEVCAFANNRRVTSKQARVHIGLSEANGRSTLHPADRRGCARVRPMSTDAYLLHSVLILPIEQSDADWESHFAALTVHRAVFSSSPLRSQP